MENTKTTDIKMVESPPETQSNQRKHDADIDDGPEEGVERNTEELNKGKSEISPTKNHEACDEEHEQEQTQITELRKSEKKIQDQLDKYIQVDKVRNDWYIQVLKDYEDHQLQVDIDIPDCLSEEERSGLEKFKDILKCQIETCENLKTKVTDMESRSVREKEVMDELDTERRRMDYELKIAREEADNLRLRLSKVAGAKMTEGNPNITDLNDPNRPIKLAERYSELSDNEWTNAFVILTEKFSHSEESSIKRLLQILTECYKECTKHSDEQLKRLSRALTMTKTENAHRTLKEIGFQETELKDLKNLRRIASKESSERIVEKVKTALIENRRLDEELLQELDTYIEACTRLSWEMALQDPPLHMFWELKKDDSPNDMFKTYTQSGTKVSFVVWPCLLRQEGGDLLAKGVYQLYK
ncbi:cingulin-like [Argopecten irradians]|uniref:cingulin-like n=1 Tax=Argopecten irradians TaxID=31199 RepID=UPI00371C70AF